MIGDIESARAAFARREWGDAFALLTECGPLAAEDVERLAIAASLIGHDDASSRAWEQAHLEFGRLGDTDRAARCAFWLGFGLMLRGETAQGGGWIARATRLLDDAGADCAARGYLLVPAFLDDLEGGNSARAHEVATEMLEIARRFADRDLLAFGLLCSGEASISLGRTTRGLQHLDEAMVAVSAGEVSPILAGIIYCAVILACMDAFDLRRAAEWTRALDQWCDTQPDLVPYRGQCLVHRSQILQAHGAWPEAVVDAERARQRLSDATHPALASALVQQGDLHRLRGDLGAAERAYRAAHEQGVEPAPGIALLRLAQGRVDTANATVRRMVDENRGQTRLPMVLAAAVEIMLAAGHIDSARAAAEEFAEIAGPMDAPLLNAISAYATACVRMAEGEAVPALALLRRAGAVWRELEMPYETARAREQIATCCRLLGDDDASTLELEAALTTFERLGARPDVIRVERTLRRETSETAPKLTEREREVLRLVAAGRSNREIAAELCISHHTVGRHLQNIFLRLGLSSRAAATAYAYEHDLV